MEEVTNEMIINCLEFIQDAGGEVSRYSLDLYITRNIGITESFNIVPKKLVDEGFIDIMREEKGIKTILTPIGVDKIKMPR